MITEHNQNREMVLVQFFCHSTNLIYSIVHRIQLKDVGCITVDPVKSGMIYMVVDTEVCTHVKSGTIPLALR